MATNCFKVHFSLIGAAALIGGREESRATAIRKCDMVRLRREVFIYAALRP